MTWHEELWLGKEREIEKKDKEERMKRGSLVPKR